MLLLTGSFSSIVAFFPSPSDRKNNFPDGWICKDIKIYHFQKPFTHIEKQAISRTIISLDPSMSAVVLQNNIQLHSYSKSSNHTVDEVTIFDQHYEQLIPDH